MNTLKAISYAYPGSPNAETLGFSENGCWHIELTYTNIEGSGQCRTFLPHDATGYASPINPDLLELFGEYDAVPDPSFLRYGNADALRALNLNAAQ